MQEMSEGRSHVSSGHHELRGPHHNYTLEQLITQLSTHQRNYSRMGQPVSKACEPLTREAAAFTCDFTCAVTAMIAPHFHHFHVMRTCNPMITSQSYGHTHLWMVKRMTSLYTMFSTFR